MISGFEKEEIKNILPENIFQKIYYFEKPIKMTEFMLFIDKMLKKIILFNNKIL